MIKAIFFDIDNTLLDFDEYVKFALREGFKEFGYPKYKEEMFETFTSINGGLWRDLEKGLLTFEELKKIRFQKVFAGLGFEGDGPAFEDYFRKKLWNHAVFEEGAEDLIKYLYPKYDLYSASNGPYEQQIHRMEIVGLDKFFKDNFISEDIGSQKPSEDFFKEAFRRISKREGKELLPEEAAIVGDSLTSDMTGGKKFGMKTCFYNKKNIEITEKTEIDVVCNSLLELKKAF